MNGNGRVAGEKYDLSRPGNDSKIEVENSGKGIPKDGRAKIFDRIYRADESRSRHIDVYGFGLSPTQAIGEVHGGRAQLSDTEDVVTRFVILLPYSSGE